MVKLQLTQTGDVSGRWMQRNLLSTKQRLNRHANDKRDDLARLERDSLRFAKRCRIVKRPTMQSVDVASFAPTRIANSGKLHPRYLSQLEVGIEFTLAPTVKAGESREEYASRAADIAGELPTESRRKALSRACRRCIRRIAFETGLSKNDARNLHWSEFIGVAWIILADNPDFSLARCAFRAYRQTIRELTIQGFKKSTKSPEYAEYSAELSQLVRAQHFATREERKAFRAEHVKENSFIGRKYLDGTELANMRQVRAIASALSRQRAGMLANSDRSATYEQAIALPYVSLENVEEATFFVDRLRERGAGRYVEYRLQGLSDHETFTRLSEQSRQSVSTVRRWTMRRIELAKSDMLRITTLVRHNRLPVCADWDAPTSIASQPWKCDASTASAAIAIGFSMAK